MNRVAVIDSGICNLDSVRRALEESGARPVITSDPADLRSVDRIILPGVGSFPDGMTALRTRGLDSALKDAVIGRQTPLLGLCLGMQLLASLGAEVADTPGLGWIPGSVVRLDPADSGARVPHIGWNEVWRMGSSVLLDGIPDGADFYFAHSFHFRCDDPQHGRATTPYCGGFTSVVENDLILGVQFHPEKSQNHGFRVLRNFISL